MKYPNTEIERVENGYILIQRTNKYVYDNFLEMIIVLAQQYDESDVALNMIQYCKEKAEAKQYEQ